MLINIHKQETTDVDVIISMFIEAAQSIGADGTAVSALTLAVLGLLWRFILGPMNERIKSVPTADDVVGIVRDVQSRQMSELKAVSSKLDEIESKLSAISDSENTGTHNMSEIRRDIEVVKTILNQFQGHMLYSKRSFDGNQELR